MAGIKKRGPSSIQTVRLYKGEPVMPCAFYTAKGKRMICGKVNDEIIRDPVTGNPLPFKSIS